MFAFPQCLERYSEYTGHCRNEHRATNQRRADHFALCREYLHLMINACVSVQSFYGICDYPKKR